jgi:hypothetical protein
MQERVSSNRAADSGIQGPEPPLVPRSPIVDDKHRLDFSFTPATDGLTVATFSVTLLSFTGLSRGGYVVKGHIPPEAGRMLGRVLEMHVRLGSSATEIVQAFEAEVNRFNQAATKRTAPELRPITVEPVLPGGVFQLTSPAGVQTTVRTVIAPLSDYQQAGKFVRRDASRVYEGRLEEVKVVVMSGTDVSQSGIIEVHRYQDEKK